MTRSPSKIIILLILAGCTESSVDTIAIPIEEEIPGTVVFAFRMYDNPRVARASYAAASWGDSCSASMIGPNVALTAAHCGPQESEDVGTPDPDQIVNLIFRTYYSDDGAAHNSESFECRRVIHGWPLHDLAIAYCEPDANGVSPGDKYGYLDFETREPQGEDYVYSIWWNGLLDGSSGDTSVPLYSAGNIITMDVPIWDGCLGGPAAEPVAIEMSTWAVGGASGSPNLDAFTHRILVGPTTLAPANGEGPSRHAWSIRTYLDSTILENGVYQPPVCPTGPYTVQHVQTNNFPTEYAFDFTYYPGQLDKTQNQLFDIHEDIEYRRGENLRTFYWLGFESRRRNYLWSPYAVSLDEDASPATMSFSATQPAELARHERLNLKPDTAYRVVMQLRTDYSETFANLSIGLHRGNDVVSTVILPTIVGPDPTWRSGTLVTDGDPGLSLVLSAWGGVEGAISELALIEEGATVDFDLADERATWFQFENGQPGGLADVLPRGIESGPGGVPDFALRVKPRGEIPQWSAFGSRHLPFNGENTHQVCFWVRADQGDPPSGLVRVESAGNVVFSTSFPITADWEPHCFGDIVPTSHDTALVFDLSPDLEPSEASYLIDDVSVTF